MMVNYKKGKVKKINSDILEGQTSFDDLKDKEGYDIRKTNKKYPVLYFF